MGGRILPKALALAVCAALAAGCSKQPGGQSGGAGRGGAPKWASRLLVFHAASLSRPLAELEKVFESRSPGVDVVRESSSSRVAIRKVTELNRSADIVASADEALLRELMTPHCAKWVAMFARNRIVIAYTDRSRCRSEINVDNWYDILLREDVNYGYCNPNMAPVGYRTLLSWRLADRHYADKLGGREISAELASNCPARHIRPHCNELIPLLESLALDYTFQYRSVALQHHLEWLKLPDAIDLGNEELAQEYGRVSVDVSGRTRGAVAAKVGKPIIYGITIPEDAPNPDAAQAFLALLFGPEGQQIMKDNFQEPVAPVLCRELAAVPEALRALMQDAGP